MSATWSSHDSAAGFLRATQSACDSGHGMWREGDRPLSTFGYGRRSVAVTLGWVVGATTFGATVLAVSLNSDDGRAAVVVLVNRLAVSTSMALARSVGCASSAALVRPRSGDPMSIDSTELVRA